MEKKKLMTDINVYSKSKHSPSPTEKATPVATRRGPINR